MAKNNTSDCMDDIIKIVKQASAGNYSARIALHADDCEFTELCDAVNELLDSMQNTIEREKLAKKKLLESQANLQLTIDHVGAIIWSVDRDLRFISSSGADLSLLDLKPNQVIGSTLYEFWDTTDPNHPSIASHLKALQGESVNYDQEYKGTVYHTRLHPLYDETGAIVGVSGLSIDSTAQFKFERNLRERELLLNNIIDQNPHPLWISDDKGTFLRGNQACYRMFNTCEEELVNKYNIVKDNIIAEQGFLPQARAVFEEGKTVHFTLEYDTSQLTQIALENKTKVHIEATIAPIKDEKGVITNAVVIHKDITDKVKAEHELRLTQFCIDRASIGVMRVEEDGGIASVNETICEKLGYAKDELLSMSIFEIDATFSRDGWLENRKKIRKSSSGTFESVHIRKDGSTFPVEITVNYFTFNGREYSFSFVQDITDRKEAEKSLELFKFSIDNAADSVFWLEKDGSFSYVNKQACVSLGYTYEELMGLKLWDIDPIYPKEKWHLLWNRFDKQNPRSALNLKTFHKRKDGTLFPIEVSSQHILFGDIELHVAFVRDITDREKAEKELRFKQFCIDHASLGVHQLDAEGRILLANDTFCKNLGYTRDELYQMTVFDIDPTVTKEQLTQIQRKIKENGSSVFETTHTRKDGTTFPVEITSNYISADDEEHMISFAVDITERKRWEEKLELFRFTIENAADAVYWVGKDGRFLYANKQASKSLGYTQDELKRMYVWEIDPEFPKSQWEKEMQIHVQGGENFRRHLYSNHKKKDGTIFPIEISSKNMTYRGEEMNVAFIRDISERVKAERDLRIKEFCIEHASIGIHQIDSNGRIRMVNKAFCKNLGYTKDELLSMTVFDIDPMFNRERWREHRQHTSQVGNKTLETLHRRKNDTVFPVEITVNHYLYEGEDYSFSFAVDITERKRSEESLKLFQYTIEHAPIFVMWMDPNGRFLYANQKACRSLGYTLDELKQMVMWEIDPDFGQERWFQETNRLRSTGESNTNHFISRNRRKDGSFFPVEVFGKPFFFKDKEVHVALLHDITERVEAEEVLNDQRKLLKEAQEIADLGHYRFDIPNDSWECSKTLMRIFGIDDRYAKDINGWVDLVVPEDREGLRSYLLNYVIGEKQSFDREYKIIRLCDGEERWVHGLGRLEFDETENPTFMLGTIQDITERKRVEEEKTKLESQLIQAQKMESVGRLAGGVAHDFNNMLCVILGYVELMKNRIPTGDRLLKNIMEIEKAAVHSRDITRQLLAFSRKQIIAPIPMDMNEHVHNMTKTLSRLIGEDVILEFHPGDHLWPVLLDRSQFDQIIINLSANARDAMSEGGRLTIETSNVYLDESYCRDRVECEPGPYVFLGVSDNGVGMSKEILENIFEPFFTTKEVGEGTGLGLATVYGIVKQNNGSICVYSEPGQGTTFKLYFPQLEDASNKQDETPSTETTSGTETILLVEDDEMVREMTKSMLESMGYKVFTAKNPEDSVRIVERHSRTIDLLLTDVVMPHVSGTELSDRIQSICPSIRVLFMSGYTSNVIVHHGVLEEGVHFVQKPFSMNDLSSNVRKALDAK